VTEPPDVTAPPDLNAPPFWEQNRGGGPITERIEAYKRAEELDEMDLRKQHDLNEVVRAELRWTGSGTRQYRAERKKFYERLVRAFIARWGEDPRKLKANGRNGVPRG